MGIDEREGKTLVLQRTVSKRFGRSADRVSSNATATNATLFIEWARPNGARDDNADARLSWSQDFSSQPTRRTASSQLPCTPTMTAKSQRPSGQDGALSSLNMAIDVLNLAKETTEMALAKTALGSTSNLLIMIKVGSLPVHVGRMLANGCAQSSSIDKVDYIELGLICAGVYEALNWGIGRRREDQLSQSVLQAIKKFVM